MRLVDAEVLLLKALEEKRFIFSYTDALNQELVMETVYHDLAEFILSAPVIDAVPVVRCKDCKYLMFSDCYGECSKGSFVAPNDYCSKGERRER